MKEQVWVYRRIINNWMWYLSGYDVERSIELFREAGFHLGTADSNRLGRVLLFNWWAERGMR